MRLLALVVLAVIASCANADDWPQANHDPARSGRTADEPKPPFRVQWVRQFPREVICTRVEPIVASGRVFVGTCSGRIRALSASDGRELWTTELDGPILHSAAVRDGLCLTGTAAGSIYALKTANGSVAWRGRLGDHGFATTPLLAGGLAIAGSRGGTLYGIDLKTGKLKWRLGVGAPIRTSACSDGSLVYFAAEDMRARACDLATGKLRWTSAPLPGQSLRDYYPVIAGSRIILRSNPAGPFAERLIADRAVLTKNAGVDGTDWRALDAFLKSEKSSPRADLNVREQSAIREHLRVDTDGRTLHILDAATGLETALAPVMYGAGCQGVGFPPAATPGGGLLVFHRSAYNNWSLGVAPLVGIGYLDPRSGSLQPIRHESGPQPPWNTFWGTADETTRFTVGGRTLFLSHQGTIGAFDLRSRKLTTVAGKRDTWGGYPGVPWARNEWHGPARGALAISGSWIYWMSGSRIIAIRGEVEPGAPQPKPVPEAPPPGQVEPDTVPIPSVSDLAEQLRAAPTAPTPSTDGLEGRLLDSAVAVALSENWRPLYTQPGLAGREFFFDRPSERFEALLAAYPHTIRSVQSRIREHLEAELSVHLPTDPRARYPVAGGKPREHFRVSEAFLKDAPPVTYPLEGMHSVWLYASRLNEWDAVLRQMSARPDCFRFEDLRSVWPAIVKQRDARTNRVVADVLAYARIASWFNLPTAGEARRMAAEGVLELIDWMRSYDPAKVERPIGGVAQIDAVIGSGNGLFDVVKPHKARIGRLVGLTPELARILAAYAPNHLRALFSTIDIMMPGWYLMGEERQVHFGENFFDYPDQALAIFTARAAAGFDPPERLKAWLDMPFCRADLYDIQKRALYLTFAPVTGQAPPSMRHALAPVP